MATLNYDWMFLTSWSVSKGSATVTFSIYAKIGFQNTNENYSLVDTRLDSAIVNNLAGAGYDFQLTGSQGEKGDGIWTFRNQTILYGQYRVNHNQDGTASSTVSASVYNRYWGISNTFSGSFDLPKINRYPVLIEGSNFTDEGNPILKFNSFGNYDIKVKLEVADQPQFITRLLTDRCATSYTFDLTETERNNLRNLIPNNNELTVRETVCAIDDDGEELSYSYKDYKMTIVNANPQFSNFNFEDINETTLALTGNNHSVITGYSKIKVTIPTTYKAVPQKKATMVKYRSTIGENNTKDFNYSSTSEVNTTLENVSSGIINTYAIDSRGNSTLVTKQATNIVNYKPIIVGSISAVRTNGNVGTDVKLTYNGTFDNINFGSTQNNIVKATYTLQKTDSTVVSTGIGNIIPTISGNTFSFEGEIAGNSNNSDFDLNSSYIIKVKVYDRLSVVEFTTTLPSAIPNIALHKSGVGIMGAYDEDEGGVFQIKSKPLEKIIAPTILFDDSSGKKGNFTLSDNINNYDYIEIFGDKTSSKIYIDNRNEADIELIHVNNDNIVLIWCVKKIHFNGKNANVTLVGRTYTYQGQITNNDNVDEVPIYKVIGYKYAI